MFSIDDFCKSKKLSRNGSKLVDMIDNLLSRIIELRAAVNESQTAALDIQMHCIRSLMVKSNFINSLSHIVFEFEGILRTIRSFTNVH